MPNHEVFPILGYQLSGGGYTSEVKKDNETNRGKMAEEIKAVYDDVTSRNGEIVGGHVIPGQYPHNGTAVGSYTLFLVARFN